MVASGGAAGEEPDDPPDAASLQPSDPPGTELGQPVPISEALANMASEFAEEARRLQENLHRRQADQALIAELAAHKFGGWRYEYFQNELTRYGISVLRGWMHSGYIFKLAADRGFALHPSEAELEELHRDSDAREDLAAMTIASALPRFRQKALVDGGWRVDGGASLSTYFMGACLYEFPNELRKLRVQRKRWRLQDAATPVVDDALVGHRVDDPAVIAAGNQRVRDELMRVDPRTRAVVALTIEGYSQEEIVELLDGETSVRAIEGVLHRWRKKMKGDNGGGESGG